ncbi:MAG: hypothetical protein ABSG21_07290 [Spirochaetia bacterium]|jgi:hypothetical protein
MWYVILITLVVDLGGIVLVYLLLRDRVGRAVSAESRISEIREEVSRLLVELNQATNRNIELMEDKITILNDAISTADKKIGLLRRETEKHDVGSQIYSRLAEGRHQIAAESAVYRDAESAGYRDAESAVYRGASSAPPLAVELSEQNPRGTAPRNPPGALSRIQVPVDAVGGAESTGYAGPESAVNRAGAAPDGRQRVITLYRAGFSPSLIASRVGAPVGEVELIIALEQRKGQA